MNINQIFPTNLLIDFRIPVGYHCRIIFEEFDLDLLSNIFDNIYSNLDSLKLTSNRLISNFDYKLINLSSSDVFIIEIINDLFIFYQPIEGFYLFVFSAYYKQIFSKFDQSYYMPFILEEISYLRSREGNSRYANKLEFLANCAA